MLSLVLILAIGMQPVESDVFSQLREKWAHNLHEKRVEMSLAEYAPDADFIQPDGQRAYRRGKNGAADR